MMIDPSLLGVALVELMKKKIINISLYNVYSVYQSVILMGM